MNLLNNLTIKARLIFLVGFALALMIIIGVMGMRAGSSATERIQVIYQDQLVPNGQLSRIIELMRENRTQLLLAMQHAPGSSTRLLHNHPVSKHTDAVTENAQTISEIWKAYVGDGHEPDEQALADDFSRKRSIFVKQGLLAVSGLLQAGDYEQAARVFLERVIPTFHEAHNAVGKLWQWQLDVAKQSYQDAVAEGARFGYITIGLMVVGGVLLSLLALLTIRGIVGTVAGLKQAAAAVEAGDLSVRFEHDAKDELGEMADAFNGIVGKFRSVIAELGDATVQLASAAEETSVITDETSERIRRQQAETEQVATAMTQMVSTVQEVAQNATTADHSAQQADTLSSDGRTVASEALSATRDLAAEIEKATEVIHGLEEESNSIGGVLDVIGGIAEQTNLLALNAAIEAARAGEQGRGFAVVADEVRTLAGRTQTSTQEIQTMIERLQQGAGRAVTAMSQGQQKVEHSLERVEQADRALDEISRSVEQIKDMNRQIATAAEQQGAVADEINRNIISISELSTQSAQGAEQTSVASTQQARLASDLQSMAGQFKT